ncbi:unnamed protein product, partial [Scytosiphon promiscuus]
FPYAPRSLAALGPSMETPDSGASGEVLLDHGKSLLANAASADAAPSLLRYAAQPDVVLSQERDLYYASTLLAEGTSELAETLLGSRRVMILAPELRALASCLYFVLTNLAGKQTLGQEYCGVHLVDPGARGAVGGDGSPLLPRRPLQVYTFMRVAVPYLQVGQAGVGDAIRGDVPHSCPRDTCTTYPCTHVACLNFFPNDTAADRRGLEEEQHQREHAVSSEPAGGADPSGRSRGDAAPLARHRPRFPPPALAAMLRRVLAWARRRRPEMSGVLEWALRLHLAAFYLDGRFANPAMRAVGARLAYVRSDQEAPQTRYAVLGLLLLVQAAAEAASASAETAGRWRVAAGTALSERFSDRGAEAAAAGGVGAQGGLAGSAEGDNEAPPSLPRVPAVTPERDATNVALFPSSRRRCSLCMSSRENAAATPCGHLFCWDCIVGWCQTNPECPLCRQPASPQSIVCLYQYA